MTASPKRPRLLLDAGPYSLSATGITGIGVRVAELAETLAVHFPVLVSMEDTTDCVDIAAAVAVPAALWDKHLAESDVVFFFDLPDPARLEQAAAAGKRIVTENAPPIEHLEYPSLLRAADPAGAHRALVAAFERQLQVSHHFLCRSRVERVALVACLCLAGRLAPQDIARSRTLSHLISTVPIGFSAASEATAARRPSRPLADVLWTGGIWTYFHPLLLVDAMALCRDAGTPMTAAFLYAQPSPDNRESIRQVSERIAALGLDGAVRLIGEPLRHQERDGIIKGARALVCVARPGIENETCVRLRARDSRLYGVPSIVDSGGPTGAELAADGLGYVLTSDDPGELAETLIKITRDGTGPAGAHPGYRYDRTLGNLMDWLLERAT